MSRCLASVAVLLLVLLAAPSVAHADFGLVPNSFQAPTLDAAGQPDLRAGAHPDRLVTSFAFNTDGATADGNVKDVVVDLPAGFVGDAGAVSTCLRAAFAQGSCPPESQVGVMRATFLGLGKLDLAIYNIAAQEEDLAEFGFTAVILPVRLIAGVRSDSDYGTRIELHDLPQNLPLTAGEIELWGVPADHQSGTPMPRRAFLTNPTRCDQGPPTTMLRVRSWQQPADWIVATAAASAPLNGCDAVPFDPALSLGLDTPAADTPSGMRVDLMLPQNDDPDGVAASHLRDAAITLPEGVTLSPAVAEGLTVCDDDQLAIGTTRAPACPPSSKIGTVQLQTSLLPNALDGDVYLGRRLPTDMYRLFVVANGPGFAVKLAGSLRPDPQTGRLTTVLDDLPDLPFSRVSLHFKDGPRAPLATPPGCGSGTGTASLTPYRGGAPTTVSTTIAIASGPGGAPCPAAAPFAPLFVAGTSPPVGGGDSSFSMTVRRADGEQMLERVALTLPPGLTARLATVARCPADQAAAASCPPDSRVGSVAVEAGAGPRPLAITGAVYLTGPQRQAPFGLALVLRALAGPLDLGTVVVPATLRVDPLDGRLAIATQALPQVLAGVPLRLQTLALDIDRPGFMLNPTSCDPAQIVASIRSVDEATSRSSARFAIGNCRRLAFDPTVSMSLAGKRELRRGGHPEVKITLRPRASQAHLSTARVELPSMLTLNMTAVTALCSRPQAREGRCPKGSVVGSARARTPLLSQPLTGSVNVVQPTGNGQPDLWATLAGAGVRLSVRSTTAVPHGKPMSSTFVDLPDIPLSAFSLSLRGGRHGLLSVATGFCHGKKASPIVVRSSLRAQNGKLRSVRVRVHAHPSCSR